MVEMIVTIIILGIALITITSMMTNSLSSNANTYEETRMTALARSYLDEILSRRYDENSHPSGTPACDGGTCTDQMDFGPDSGEGARDKWDDVDDYHGLVEVDDTITDLEDAAGNPRTGYDGYTVEVTITYVGHLDPINKELTDAKLITVAVTSPLNPDPTEFQVFRANF